MTTVPAARSPSRCWRDVIITVTIAIPEAPAGNWKFARRGEFYRPVIGPVTIRLDADVVAWFKEHSDGKDYQTEINRVLRRHVAGTGRRRSRR